MFPRKPRFFMAPEGAGVGTVTAPTAATTTQADDKGAEIKALADKAAALEAKLKARDDADKKNADTKKAAEIEAANKKAIEDGQAKQLIEKQAADLKAAQDRLAAVDEATQKRIDAMVAKMSDKSKAKIEMVKGSMTKENLLVFCEVELDSSSTSDGAPIAGGTPGGGGTNDKVKLRPEAENILGESDIGTGNMAMFKKEVDPMDPLAVKLVLPIKSLIDNLRGRAQKPVKMANDEWLKRSAQRR